MREDTRTTHYQFVVSYLNPELDRERQQALAGTYLLTFACYGARVHGETDTVDRLHNVPGTPRLPENTARAAAQRQSMIQPPYCLDRTRRSVTLRAIQEVCSEKMWTLLAIHVRTSHIHVVVQAADSPEWVTSTLKRFASRALNNLGIDDQKDRRRWARHGSTRYIWTREQLSAAIRYTVSGQGEPLAVYEAP